MPPGMGNFFAANFPKPIDKRSYLYYCINTAIQSSRKGACVWAGLLSRRYRCICRSFPASGRISYRVTIRQTAKFPVYGSWHWKRLSIPTPCSVPSANWKVRGCSIPAAPPAVLSPPIPRYWRRHGSFNYAKSWNSCSKEQRPWDWAKRSCFATSMRKRSGRYDGFRGPPCPQIL